MIPEHARGEYALWFLSVCGVEPYLDGDQPKLRRNGCKEDEHWEAAVAMARDNREQLLNAMRRLEADAVSRAADDGFAERLVQAVMDCRRAQRTYFRGKAPEDLPAAKQAEHRVDALLDEWYRRQRNG